MKKLIPLPGKTEEHRTIQTKTKHCIHLHTSFEKLQQLNKTLKTKYNPKLQKHSKLFFRIVKIIKAKFPAQLLFTGTKNDFTRIRRRKLKVNKEQEEEEDDKDGELLILSLC